MHRTHSLTWYRVTQTHTQCITHTLMIFDTVWDEHSHSTVTLVLQPDTSPLTHTQWLSLNLFLCDVSQWKCKACYAFSTPCLTFPFVFLSVHLSACIVASVSVCVRACMYVCMCLCTLHTCVLGRSQWRSWVWTTTHLLGPITRETRKHTLRWDLGDAQTCRVIVLNVMLRFIIEEQELSVSVGLS